MQTALTRKPYYNEQVLIERALRRVEEWEATSIDTPALPEDSIGFDWAMCGAVELPTDFERFSIELGCVIG